ncbi:DUF6518 family protein [Kitasatospora sp. NPDC056076]|uniref:DUF6518 family protein n=1 Tax=Kitasatospora sp. NPDC056076 TaxID=3345703 RepID=UPI0035DD16A9
MAAKWPRFRIHPYVAGPAAGASLGCLGPLLIGVDNHAVQAVHIIASTGCSWVALAFFVGLSQATRLKAAIMAPLALITGVLAYYLVKVLQGGYRTFDLNTDPMGTDIHISWAEVCDHFTVWCSAATVLGPLLGAAGNTARSRQLRDLPARMAVPVLVIIESARRLSLSAAFSPPASRATWTATLAISIAAATVILTIASVRHWRTRSDRNAIV